MKICPKCGRVADEDAVRCFCGTDLGSIKREETKTSSAGSGVNMKINVGHYTLSVWEIVFILLCNLGRALGVRISYLACTRCTSWRLRVRLGILSGSTRVTVTR